MAGNQRGDLPAARQYIDGALPHATKAAQRMLRPTDDLYAISLRLVATGMHFQARDYDAARTLANEALHAALAAPHQRHLRSVCSAHECLALCALFMHEDSTQHIDAMVAAARTMGLTVMVSSGPYLRGRAAINHGRYEAACSLFVEAQARLSAAKSRQHWADCTLILGWTLLRLDKLGEGVTALRSALDEFDALDDPLGSAAARTLLADAWCRSGESAHAMETLEAEIATLLSDVLLWDALPRGAQRAAAWRVLQASRDPRAPLMREQAIRDIQTDAAQVRDASARARMLAGAPDSVALRLEA
jgi:tetratricopeptide (TPR) repeat protein